MNRRLDVAAAIGAGVTLVAGIVPFVQLVAPVIGGGVAAYVSDASPEDGIKAGGAAGLLALLVYVPLFVVGSVAFISFTATLPTASGPDAGVGATILLATLLSTIILVPTASALGGAFGGVANERREQAVDTRTTDAETGSETPIERLEQRYVDGEIEEARFESQLDTILRNRAEHGDENDETLLTENE